MPEVTFEKPALVVIDDVAPGDDQLIAFLIAFAPSETTKLTHVVISPHHPFE
jgi:hypothetical protein